MPGQNVNQFTQRLFGKPRTQQQDRPTINESAKKSLQLNKAAENQADEGLLGRAAKNLLDNNELMNNVLSKALKQPDIQKPPQSAQSVGQVQPDTGRQLSQLAQTLPQGGLGGAVSSGLQGAAVGIKSEDAEAAADEFNSFLSNNPEASMEQLAAKAQEIGTKHNIPRLQKKAKQLRQRSQRGLQRDLQEREIARRNVDTIRSIEELRNQRENQALNRILKSRKFGPGEDDQTGGDGPSGQTRQNEPQQTEESGVLGAAGTLSSPKEETDKEGAGKGAGVTFQDAPQTVESGELSSVVEQFETKMQTGERTAKELKRQVEIDDTLDSDDKAILHAKINEIENDLNTTRTQKEETTQQPTSTGDQTQQTAQTQTTEEPPSEEQTIRRRLENEGVDIPRSIGNFIDLGAKAPRNPDLFATKVADDETETNSVSSFLQTEMQNPQSNTAQRLANMVASGQINEENIDDVVEEVNRIKRFKFAERRARSGGSSFGLGSLNAPPNLETISPETVRQFAEIEKKR